MSVPKEWRSVRKVRRARETSKIFWKIFLWPALAISVFFGAALLSDYPTLQLEKITIVGINLNAKREILKAEAAVARAFANEGARLFSPENILLYPKRAISENISSSSPRISFVQLKRGGRILIVAVKEREPFAEWCDYSKDNKCVFIDENGLGFSKVKGDNESSITQAFLSKYPESGKHYLPETDFSLLREIISSARRVGLSITKVSKEDGNDFSFLLADGSEAKFVLSEDAGKLFLSLPETLRAADLSISNGIVSPALQYLDLRFRDQIVFKRK